MNQHVIGNRSVFLHGDDCRVKFFRRNDTKNSAALIDVWEVEPALGQRYYLSLMKMKSAMFSDRPWVFGSIYNHSSLLRRDEVWSFTTFSKFTAPKFHGDVYTKIGEDGLTYVMFLNRDTGVVKRLLLSKFLKDISPDAVLQNKPASTVPVVEVTVLPEVATAPPVLVIALAQPQQAKVLEIATAPPKKRTPRDELDPMNWFLHNVLANMCEGANA